MKPTLLLSFFLAAAVSLQAQEDNDPVLMTVGGDTVTRSEFVSIYRKNNPAGSGNATSLEDYLSLFINFKLKVKEAVDLGMDTAKAFRDELAGYRDQLARPYLTDNEVTEHLIQEAYERAKTDISASHILVKMDRHPHPKDTAAAYRKALDILKRVKTSGESFAAVANEVAAASKGAIIREDLNFGVLSMVYAFETAAYNAREGDITGPVRTPFGYHIIHVTGKRPSLGQVKAAHIMVQVSRNATPEEQAEAQKRIDEAYRRLQEGTPFEDLAREVSDDKGTGSKGGVLPWFGTGRMVPEFEQAVAALRNISDYSVPVRTNYGWHIVKLLDRKPIPEFEAMKPELKERIARDARSQVSRESILRKIRQEYGVKENTAALEPIRKVVDETVFSRTWSPARAAGLNQFLFSIGEEKYYQSDFAAYIGERQRPAQGKVSPADFVDVLYRDFADDMCIAYEDRRLEQKHADFRALLKEYHDGILLFELTDRKVWSKAVKDSAGLEAFYEKNKDKYMWEERADVTVFACTDDKALAKARKLAAKKTQKGYSDSDILSKINTGGAEKLRIKERGLFLKGENELVDATGWKPGPGPDTPSEGAAVFVLVNRIVPPVRKTLKEARGLVTADYQEYLEQEWLGELKARYGVVVNRDVLSTIQ